MAKPVTDSRRNTGKKPSLVKSREMESLFMAVVSAMAETLIARGVIDIHGKTEEQINEGIEKEFANIASGNVEIKLTIDYTNDLLNEARKNKMTGEYPIAFLFYSIFFEHSINRFIDTSCSRKKIHFKTFQSIIRESSLRSKATWILQLLGLNGFPSHHMNTINRINEQRNAFVHYKWKEAEEGKEKESLELCTKAEKVVNYIRYFENKHYFQGKKHKIARRVKKRG